VYKQSMLVPLTIATIVLMEKSMKWQVVVGIGVIIVLGLLVWLIYKTQSSEQIAPVNYLATTTKEEGLGGELYKESGSAGQQAVPAPSPTPNPGKDFYKNPFE